MWGTYVVNDVFARFIPSLDRLQTNTRIDRRQCCPLFTAQTAQRNETQRKFGQRGGAL